MTALITTSTQAQQARLTDLAARPGELDFNDRETHDISRIAQSRGWQVAAHDYMRTTNPRAYRLAVDEYSAQVRFLLALTPESRVLQMRSGWGAIALNLADCAGSVVALDDRPDMLRFLTTRRDQAAASSLEVVCSSPTAELPFPDGGFDSVVMFDTLETVGAGQGASTHQNQQQVLAEVHRVLQSGGSLLLGVPNRLGFARAAVDKKQNPRAFWGYRDALRKAGFSNIRFYAPLPSHLEPFFIIPLNRSSLFKHFVDWMFTAQDYRSKLEARGMGAAYHVAWSLWRTGRHLGVAGLAKYVVPSYLILSEKEAI